MLAIPILDVPSQIFKITLANQICEIHLTTRHTGLYCDMYVNNVLIIGGVLCENVNRIVRSLYLGFVGDFIFTDTQGNLDPSWPGLGGRFQFCYLTAADLDGAG